MKNKTNLSNATKTTIKQNFLGYLYLLPTLVITLIFVVYPLIMSFRMGFYEKYNYYTEVGTGFGLSTFKFVLSDPNFQKALLNTFLIVVIAVPVSMVIALAIALLLNSGIKASKFFQAIYFLPYVTSVIAIGIVWSWLFHSDFGYINQFLSMFGIEPIQWLNDPNMAIWALIIFNIWSGLAFKIVIFLSGLQNIDPQYYKAAQVDGTPKWKVFTRITLPLLSPTVFFLTITSVIGSFKVYNEVFALFGGKPGPANSCMTVVYYIYDMFYGSSQVHKAAAASIILFVIILIITGIQMLVSKKLVHYK
ncbi:MAG: sugar ABC transporter permease [Turicibacter sp.]|nr:sugar ABC transporter permease [Turicibacter sp.]CUP64657.1 Inner membrane ABC transporter permease protein ycjO [Turicibacter sanguinis]